MRSSSFLPSEYCAHPGSVIFVSTPPGLTPLKCWSIRCGACAKGWPIGLRFRGEGWLIGLHFFEHLTLQINHRHGWVACKVCLVSHGLHRITQKHAKMELFRANKGLITTCWRVFLRFS
jgi:hypothetical protein